MQINNKNNPYHSALVVRTYIHIWDNLRSFTREKTWTKAKLVSIYIYHHQPIGVHCLTVGLFNHAPLNSTSIIGSRCQLVNMYTCYINWSEKGITTSILKSTC